MRYKAVVKLFGANCSKFRFVIRDTELDQVVCDDGEIFRSQGAAMVAGNRKASRLNKTEDANH